MKKDVKSGASIPCLKIKILLSVFSCVCMIRMSVMHVPIDTKIFLKHSLFILIVLDRFWYHQNKSFLLRFVQGWRKFYLALFVKALGELFFNSHINEY